MTRSWDRLEKKRRKIDPGSSVPPQVSRVELTHTRGLTAPPNIDRTTVTALEMITLPRESNETSPIPPRKPVIQASVYQTKQKSVPDLQIPWYTNPKELNFAQDKYLQVELFIMPDRLGELVTAPKRHSLSEVYYTTQTLPLVKLLPSATKTLTTATYYLSLLEAKLVVVHTRIEELKRSDRWSLRQRVKFHGPLRPKVHWDRLIDEMKWLQADFKEERKLKIATCFQIACAVKEYWKLGKEACCVKRKPIKRFSFIPNNELELFTSVEEMDSVSREIYWRFLFRPFVSSCELFYNETESYPITDVTKFLAAPDIKPEWQRLLIEVKPKPEIQIPTDKPGLFSRSNNFIPIKQPKPPNLRYLEYQTPILWLPKHDQALLSIVERYQFNWDMISSCFVCIRTFGYQSLTDLRSPWNCFERWVQLNPAFQLSKMMDPYAQEAKDWFSMKALILNKNRISAIGAKSPQRSQGRPRWNNMFEGIYRRMRNQELEDAMTQKERVVKARTNLKSPAEVLRNVMTPAELSRLKSETDGPVDSYMFKLHDERPKRSLIPRRIREEIPRRSNIARRITEESQRPQSIIFSSSPQTQRPASSSSTQSDNLGQGQMGFPINHPHVLNLIKQVETQYPNFTRDQAEQIAQNRIQKFLELQKQRAEDQQRIEEQKRQQQVSGSGVNEEKSREIK